MAIPRALVEDLAEKSDYEEVVVRDVLNSLAEAAAEAIELGEDFTVPGIVKLVFSYTPPRAKGERWRKGEEVAGFGGVVSVKDSDSEPVKARVRLKANLTGEVYRLRPGTKPAAQAAFLKSKAGKNIVRDKG